MPRIKITLQYKGTQYKGWQTQPNGLTVQEVLEKILHRLFQKKIHVVASGRTDSGVHALGQVCHFDLPDAGGIEKGGRERPKSMSRNPKSDLSAEALAKEDSRLGRLVHGINSLLPDDIVITDAEHVSDDFHAIKSAKRKIYEYTILNSFIRSPFLNEYVWQIPVPLDLQKMRKVARLLVGEHDFKAFCASDSAVKTTVRTIYRLSVKKEKGEFEGDLIKVSITGNGFLKYMVRNIVGTLVEVGKGKMTLAEFRRVFKGLDRRHAGATAPARGLILKEVRY